MITTRVRCSTCNGRHHSPGVAVVGNAVASVVFLVVVGTWAVFRLHADITMEDKSRGTVAALHTEIRLHCLRWLSAPLLDG